MKGLFIYRFCGLGGVETSVLNKLDALREHGVEAQALFEDYYGAGGGTIAADPRVSIGMDREHMVALLKDGLDFLSVIDFPDFIDRLDGLPLKTATSRVLFVETHASNPSALTSFYSRLDHPRIEAVVVPSEFNRRLVREAVGDHRQVVVIRNPIDGRRFSSRPVFRLENVALPEGGPLLLWVGRLEEEKNPLGFVRVAAKLLSSRPDLRFLIVGDAFSTTEYQSAQNRLYREIPTQWRERFAFAQSIPYDRMPDVYSLAGASGGCLVSTSHFESAPMTLIEAMSCGCPVVASDVGGVSDLLVGGEIGRLFPRNDYHSAANAVATLIDAGRRAEREQLVKRAQTAVQERHAPGVIGAQYKSLLESLAVPAVVKKPLRQARLDPVPPPDGVHQVVPGMVSAIIPVYNRPVLLREAVDSVLSQTYRNFEIIIVDDGSTDDTPQVCDELAHEHPEIRALHLEHQGRAGLAREAGRRVARGEYIQYLDSDDLIMPEKFSRMVQMLQVQPECDIAYCYTRRYRLGAARPITPAERTGETFDRMRPDFLSRRYWCTSTPLYRRSLCDRIGSWSDLLFWEDIEYDVRAATHHPRLCHCTHWLTEMRDHDLGRLSGSRFLEDPQLLAYAVQGVGLLYENIRRWGLTIDDPHVRSFVDDVRVVYNRCRAFDMAPQADECEAILMDATGCADRDRVGDYQLKANIEPQSYVLKMRPGSVTPCPVQVINESTMSFHAGEFATELGYHLLEADGSPRRVENPKLIFTAPLEPGASRLVELPIHAPRECGLYYAEIDIFWAACKWLKTVGNPTAFVKLLVTDHPADHRWRLQVADGNSAELLLDGGEAKQRLVIRTATTATPWHIQLNYEGLSVAAKQRYVLRFEARADGPRRLIAAVSRAHPPWSGLGLYQPFEASPEWRSFEMDFTASDSDDDVRIHFDAGGAAESVEISRPTLCAAPDGEPISPPALTHSARLQMDVGVRPLSEAWGTDRGLPLHRYYLEQFLQEFADDIGGRCLEFQDPQYTWRFGGDRVGTLDILHIDSSNPRATLVADLTQPNDLASDDFDCIVCTHVLHVIYDVERAVREIYRILKPGGVLLTAVPHISMVGPEYGEMWRFTPQGLETLLNRVFGVGHVAVRAYGNSLTAAGEIRGVVSHEFSRSECDTHDVRFPVEVCARAVKRG